MPKDSAIWKNRITGYADVPPDQLMASPANFRRHPKNQQDAFLGVVDDVGFVDPVLVQQSTGMVLDGHLRVELALRTNQPTIPVKYVDLTDAEAALVRWRGRYNEDTILSLDMLKAGWCTIQFNAFLQGKVHTQTMKGGNTDELYREGTLAKSQMMVTTHPDVSRVVWKFNRWHHHVDYRRFKRNQLKLKPGIDLSTMEPNEYGMKLVNVKTRESVAMAAD